MLIEKCPSCSQSVASHLGNRPVFMAVESRSVKSLLRGALGKELPVCWCLSTSVAVTEQSLDAHQGSVARGKNCELGAGSVLMGSCVSVALHWIYLRQVCTHH